VTVIRGGAATPNKYFIKIKQHDVFLGSTDCYDKRQFSFYEPIVRLLYNDMLLSHSHNIPFTVIQ